MRDRLIELLEQIAGMTDDNACKDCDGDCVRCAYETVADYLLANGVIVPPCKVGDTVYKTSVLGEITELKIKGFDCGIATEPYNIIPIENFGKTVFLTKEKAEQAALEEALEELKKYNETH